MLERVRMALRIVDHEFDSELVALIAAAVADLKVAGVNVDEVGMSDSLVDTAIVTYCKMHFGEPDQYDRLKQSYDEQKAQLSTHTGHTTWEVING